MKSKLVKVLLLALLLLSISTLTSNAKQEVKIKEQTISIDNSIFNETQNRLNTQIYTISENVINTEHVNNCYKDCDTELFNSFVNNLTPLVPIALTLNEYGTAKSTQYTWSSAVYSKFLSNVGVDMNSISVSEVNADTYAVMGLGRYLLCGDNCTAGNTTHVHIGGGSNDNDSLGPLQIRRHYVEELGGIKTYPCGESTEDLMCWKDNVEYFFHNQCNTFSNDNSWVSNYPISNTYELVALVSAIHNTGSGFINSTNKHGSGGSLWKDSESVVKYCHDITSGNNQAILNSYVDKWYVSTVIMNPQGEFPMAGEYSNTSELSKLLDDMGILKSKYANGWKHKQYYPLKAILNYMSLERLYNTSSIDNKIGETKNTETELE